MFTCQESCGLIFSGTYPNIFLLFLSTFQVILKITMCVRVCVCVCESSWSDDTGI